MTQADLLSQRLHNQRLTAKPFNDPRDAVAWLGAVQAQDYPAAKWALAQRMRGATDAAIDRVFAAGAIVRTHVMRPTWHFVLPEDIRWMLALTAPRVSVACRSYYRKMNLDDAVFARSQEVLARALRGGQYLTRPELARALGEAGITSAADDKLRVTFIVLRAELDAVICSGPWNGRQSTYALFDERVPRTRTLSREEALPELAARYFRSHAPATIRDFAWWSGLTSTEARAGLESIRSSLTSEQIDGKAYWRPRRAPRMERSRSDAHLLTTYDECLVAYRDRAPFDRRQAAQIARASGQMIAIGGRFVGTWRRSNGRGGVAIETTPFDRFTRRERTAIDDVAERYGRFLGAPVTVRG